MDPYRWSDKLINREKNKYIEKSDEQDIYIVLK